MYSSQRLLTFSALVAAFVDVGRLGAQSPSNCLGEHSYIADQRTELTRVVTGTDTTSVRIRNAFGLIPASASDVSLITDETVCTQAAQAFVSSIGSPGDPVRPVWVLKLGPDRYFVADGFRKSSGRFVAVIFDGSFVQKRTLLTG
jgi:hypothetical protein